MVAQTLADRQLPLGTDTAAKEDSGRTGRSRGEYDYLRLKLACRCRNADRLVARQQDAVHELAAEDRQIVVFAGRVG